MQGGMGGIPFFSFFFLCVVYHQVFYRLGFDLRRAGVVGGRGYVRRANYTVVVAGNDQTERGDRVDNPVLRRNI